MRLAGEQAIAFGGSSEIAVAILAELAAAGLAKAVLVGRDERHLAQAKAALGGRGLAVETLTGLSAERAEDHPALVERAFSCAPQARLAIVSVGALGPRNPWPRERGRLAELVAVNGTGAGSLLLECAARLASQGGGTVVLLSSVAAVRPRPANFLYGAAKAAAERVGEGVAIAAAREGVRVVTVRPGFVRTRMTAGLPQPPLAVDPAAVGRAVREGLERDRSLIYVPKAMRFVAWALALAPRRLVGRLPG